MSLTAATADRAASARRMDAELEHAIAMAEARKRSTRSEQHEAEEAISRADLHEHRIRQLVQDTQTLRGRMAGLESFNEILLAIDLRVRQLEETAPDRAPLERKIERCQRFLALLNAMTRFAEDYAYRSVDGAAVDRLMALFNENRDYINVDIATSIRLESLFREVFAGGRSDKVDRLWAAVGGIDLPQPHGVLVRFFTIVSASRLV
jgi:hypothetical protein